MREHTADEDACAKRMDNANGERIGHGENL